MESENELHRCTHEPNVCGDVPPVVIKAHANLR